MDSQRTSERIGGAWSGAHERAAAATQRDYFALDAADGRTMRVLGWTGSSARRAPHLMQLGDHEMHRAAMHTEVFGLDRHDDGTPAAEWLADSARLLWIVAEAEHVRSGPYGWPSAAYRDRLDVRTVDLQRQADHLLDLWAGGPKIRRRDLVPEMVQLWYEITGGNAVEGVHCAGMRLPRWAR